MPGDQVSREDTSMNEIIISPPTHISYILEPGYLWGDGKSFVFDVNLSFRFQDYNNF